MNLDIHKIGRLIGCHKHEEDVVQNWPLIDNALSAMCDIQKLEYTDNGRIGALATIAVETAYTFQPIKERGSDVLHEKEYGGRKDLGNVHPGDGAKYAGRGFVQRTGERNYEESKRYLGVDVVSNPNLLLDPIIAAADFALYFALERPCIQAANARNWTRIRELVNGGHNNLAEFLSYVKALDAASQEEKNGKDTVESAKSS